MSLLGWATTKTTWRHSRDVLTSSLRCCDVIIATLWRHHCDDVTSSLRCCDVIIAKLWRHHCEVLASPLRRQFNDAGQMIFASVLRYTKTTFGLRIPSVRVDSETKVSGINYTNLANHWRCHSQQNSLPTRSLLYVAYDMCCGCGTVDKAVTTETRGTLFKSSHCQLSGIAHLFRDS